MQRLAPEIDNIRAAFDWATEHDRDIDTAIALASGSAMLMRWLALSHDGMKWILPLRAHIGRVTDLSTQALFWTGVSLMGLEGRLPSAELLDANRLALTAYRETGERRRLIQGLYVIGWSLAGQRCFHELDLVLDEMRQNERAGDPPWLRANRLNLVATKHLLEGQFEDAFAVHTEQQNLLTHSLGETIALIICRGNMCAALNCLGRFEDVISIVETMRAEVGQQQWVRLTYGTFQLLHAQSSLGRAAEADQTMRQTMLGWRRDGMVLFGSSHLAMLLAEQGRWADAARVDGASQAYALRSGMHPNPVRHRARRRTLALFDAAALSATDLGRWRREGEALDDDAVAALCLDQY